jgi:hypothetical protein
MEKLDLYYHHDHCPPKLRGKICYGDCVECRYSDVISNKIEEEIPKVHRQMLFPFEEKQYMIRGRIR